MMNYKVIQGFSVGDKVKTWPAPDAMVFTIRSIDKMGMAWLGYKNILGNDVDGGNKHIADLFKVKDGD